MPLYRYTAYGRDGQQLSGQEFAGNRAELERKLKSRKFILLDSAETQMPRFRGSQLAKLVAQLSPLLNSGIVVDRALQIIAEDKADAAVSDLAEKLRDGVKRGQQLSQALESMGVADPLAMTVIRAGEASGQLPEVMQTLERHFERARKLRQEISAALFYPVILVIISVLSIVLMGLYVIPTFKDLFQDRLQMLPLNVRLIFGFSDILVHWGWWMFAAIAIIGGGLYYFARTNMAVKHWWSRQIFDLPVIGKFMGKIYTSQLLGLLAVQLRNGVPLISALELIGRSNGNIILQQRMAEIQNEVRRGRNLSTAMKRFPNIPNLALRFLAIGEETGKLDSMADKAGTQIGEDVATKTKAFAAILGPMVILLMGLVIAFVVVSMLVAVYSLTDLAPK